MTCWPHISERPVASALPTRSTEPPGVYGFTIRTGRVGNSDCPYAPMLEPNIRTHPQKAADRYRRPTRITVGPTPPLANPLSSLNMGNYLSRCRMAKDLQKADAKEVYTRSTRVILARGAQNMNKQ